MSSDNDASEKSAGSHGEVKNNSTDQDSVMSDSDGLVPSNGSHMGSVSVDSIDPDSITDPLADGFVDRPQQERGGGGLNLAVETEILGSEVLRSSGCNFWWNHTSPGHENWDALSRERVLSFGRVTSLLGAGGERNNQPSTGVAKVMDTTAAGDG